MRKYYGVGIEDGGCGFELRNGVVFRIQNIGIGIDGNGEEYKCVMKLMKLIKII